MGIPKLKQTLEPYAERVVLGTITSPDDTGSTDGIQYGSDGTRTTTGHRYAPPPPPPSTPVIIDGPALVYFTYYRLLCFKHGTTKYLVPASQPTYNIIRSHLPTYAELNHAIRCFLSTLNATNGIRVEKIYFDGGLPIAKRDVRLSRLEQIRRNKLVGLRRSDSDLVFGPRRPTKTKNKKKAGGGMGWIDPGCRFRGYDHGNFLDGSVARYLHLPATVRLMPELPFMVASALEDLRAWYNSASGGYGSGVRQGNHDADAGGGMFRDQEGVDCIVEIVPGEADFWCAAHAARTGAIILTSDSDLLAFDLVDSGGSDGRDGSVDHTNKKSASVVFFDSLELQQVAPDLTQSVPEAGGRFEPYYPSSRGYRVLVGNSHRPSSITGALGIPANSLQRFCFHRFCHPTVSTHIIRQQCCHKIASDQQQKEYQAFLQRYTTQIALSNDWKDKVCPRSKSRPQKLAEAPWLQGLDPRLAELATQLWIVAYNIGEAETETEAQAQAQLIAEGETVNVYLPFLIEDPDRDSAWAYGKCIRYLAYSVLVESLPSTTAQWIAKEKGVCEYNRRGARIVGAPVALNDDLDRHDGELRGLLSRLYQLHGHKFFPASFRPTGSFFWKSFAVAEVKRQRAFANKIGPEPEWVNGYLGLQRHPYIPESWKDIHNEASVSAVLYSLRVLRQSVGLIIAQIWGANGDGPTEPLKELWRELESLPPLAELMDAVEVNDTAD